MSAASRAEFGIFLLKNMLSSRFVPELEGLRGFAILLVLLFHFGARPPAVSRLLTAPFAMGWSGVDLFFVLSGFLITGILVDSKIKEGYFSDFYLKRSLRIIPLYWITLVAYFHVIPALRPSVAEVFDTTLNGETFFWLFLQNWLPLFGRSLGPLNHLWSLAIEEQFYVWWPFVIYFVPVRRLQTTCLCLVFLTVIVRVVAILYFHLRGPALYMLTPLRIDSLAIGAFLAVGVRDKAWVAKSVRRWSWIGVISISMLAIELAVTREPQGTSPAIALFGFPALNCLWGSLLLFAHQSTGSGSTVAKLLRAASLRALGKYSYAIYIFHVPLSEYQNSVVMTAATGMSQMSQTMIWFLSKLFGVTASLVIGVISWNLVERHFLSLRKVLGLTQMRDNPLCFAPATDIQE